LKDLRAKQLSYHDLYKSVSKGDNPELINAINKLYKTYKKLYNKEILKAKRSAYEKFIKNSNNKCKAAWTVVSKESGLTNKNINSNDSSLKADIINNYFLDSVKEIQSKIVPGTTSAEEMCSGMNAQNCKFNWKLVTESDLSKIVSNLSNSKSMDAYWLSNHIIKQSVQFIKKPLTDFINKCIQLGHFPNILKLSKIIPVFKKGDKNCPENYRPISLVPIMSKVFECVMYQQLSSYFEENNLLTDSQYGFRSGRSTIMAVTRIVDEVITAFENKANTALLLFDLSKAFDCIPIKLILAKLKRYGVDEHSLKIIYSYLNGRRQFVFLGGEKSSIKDVTHGVPQGSLKKKHYE